jgi:alpha-1,3-rhamnosyl/mannosyltransferase
MAPPQTKHSRPLIAMRATPLLFPAAGVAHYIRSLAVELVAAGENLALFTPFKWGVDAAEGAAPAAAAVGVRRSLLSAIPRPRQAVRLLETALLALNSRRHRVSLYHEPATLPLPFHGPTVVTVHDLSWIRFPETHPADRRRTLERDFPRLLKSAQHVLTDSEFIKSELVSQFGIDAARITTAPLAARDCFHPRDVHDSEAMLARLGLRHRSYFLSVGTLEPRKNLRRTLRAYTSLHAEIRKHHPLVLVGARGWKSSKLEREISTLASQGSVIPLGLVSDDELAWLYCGATAVVYASLYEGFGLPALEAMASGTPVIVSDSSSLPEVVGECALKVDPLDERAIGEAMVRLIDDGALWKTLAERGLSRARNFSWRRCAELTRTVYRTTLERV